MYLSVITLNILIHNKHLICKYNLNIITNVNIIKKLEVFNFIF